MNKEPIGLYIFRYVLGLAIIFLLSMVYWSTSLLEEDVKLLRGDIAQLKNDVFSLRGTIADRAATCARISATSENSLKEDKKDDSKNILHDDPFYEKTLPKILGDNFVPKGTRFMATVGRPENLHPFSAWADIASWYDLCSGTLTRMQFGIYETMCPYFAEKIEERTDASGRQEFWIFLRNDIYWQPLKQEWFPDDLHLAPQFLRKHPVTAADFKLYYDAMMNPYVQDPGAVALRTYYNSIEELKVIDERTFVVRWKRGKPPSNDTTPRIKYMAKQLTGDLRPLPSHVYQYFANGNKIVEQDKEIDTYRTNSVWAHNFSQHWAKNIIVSCGPWIFNGFTEQKISFVRNPDFFFPLEALTAVIDIEFKNTPENIWQEFKSNKLDSYRLQPDQQGEFQEFLQSTIYEEQKKNGSGVQRLDYVTRSYTYIGWNETKPFFSNATLRTAMTMAIDRNRIVDQYLNGLGVEITGPFYIYSPDYDTAIKPIPYNPEEAKRLLEREGWVDSHGNGTREKLINGVRVPFSFALTYYVKNPTTKSICEYIATSLKDIGIQCHLNGVDTADLSATFEDKSFDAISLGWSLGTPPEDPRQLWHSSGAKEKGSSNAIGFANAKADAIIDALDYEYNPEKRKELYHRFDTIIHEEQPYTFLYTPKAALIYRDQLQNVFIPADRQDLVSGANVGEPDPAIFWIKTSSPTK